MDVRSASAAGVVANTVDARTLRAMGFLRADTSDR